MRTHPHRNAIGAFLRALASCTSNDGGHAPDKEAHEHAANLVLIIKDGRVVKDIR